MFLGEEHLLRRPFKGPPLADTSLQRAPHAIGITIRVIILQLAQDRDAHQVGRVAQQRYDFALPYVDEGISSGPPCLPWFLRWQGGVTFDAACRTHADTGLGGRDFLRMLFALV